MLVIGNTTSKYLFPFNSSILMQAPILTVSIVGFVSFQAIWVHFGFFQMVDKVLVFMIL